MLLLADPAIVVTMSGALALLFTLSAIHKLRAKARFDATLATYQIGSEAQRALVAALLPWLELTVALGLIMPVSASIAAPCGAVLLLAYAGAMAVALTRAAARGQVIGDCGCSFGQLAQPVHWPLVWRNVLLALIVLFVLALQSIAGATLGSVRTLSGYDLLTIAPAIALIAVLYATANTLLANHARQRDFHHA